MGNDLTDALKDLKDISSDVPEEVLHEIGQFGITLITTRTLKGLNADGNAFKPYAASYAKVRKRKQLRVDPPNLKVTGHMLGGMTATPAESSVEFSFAAPREADKAVWNTGLGRDFFDIRREDELKAIEEIIADSFVAKIVR